MSHPPDYHKRIADLLRLAVNAGAAEGEARNAALQACKLIAKHRMLIIERARYDELDELARRAEQLEQDVQELEQELERANRDLQRSLHSPRYPSGDPRARNLHPGAPGSQGPSPMRMIVARYASLCRQCKEHIEAGTSCLWTPGGGLTCADCATEMIQAQ